jgi:hypothetical protein
MTLEGSLSKGGAEPSPPLRRPTLPLLRGRVPLVTSGQPLASRSSTRLQVAAALSSMPPLLPPPPEDLLRARLLAALAYARHVRPSWSMAFTLALYCNNYNNSISNNIYGMGFISITHYSTGQKLLHYYILSCRYCTAFLHSTCISVK